MEDYEYMDKVVLYTIHCPACEILEKSLKQKNVEYATVTDETVMRTLGFKSLPVLEVNGDFLNYGQAWKWVNAR